MELARAIFAIIFSLGVLLLWLVLIYWTILSLRDWRKMKKAPIETMRASVSRCYEEEEYIHQYGTTVTARHMVEFKTEDGRTYNFSLSPVQYKDFLEGDSGLLELRNENFVSFQSLIHTGQSRWVGGSDYDRVYDQIVRGK